MRTSGRMSRTAMATALALAVTAATLPAQEPPPEPEVDVDALIERLELSEEARRSLAPKLERLEELAAERAAMRANARKMRERHRALLDELDEGLTPEQRRELRLGLREQGVIGNPDRPGMRGHRGGARGLGAGPGTRSGGPGVRGLGPCGAGAAAMRGRAMMRMMRPPFPGRDPTLRHPFRRW